MRYKVCSPWRACPNATEEIWWRPNHFAIEVADAKDTRNGHIYEGGAMRVIDTRTGKAAKRGKGGTVPFIGEMAWSDAVRLASDLTSDANFARRAS